MLERLVDNMFGKFCKFMGVLGLTYMAGCSDMKMPTQPVTQTPIESTGLPSANSGTPIDCGVDTTTDSTNLTLNVYFKNKDDANRFFYKILYGDGIQDTGSFPNSFNDSLTGKPKQILKTLGHAYPGEGEYNLRFWIDRNNDYISGVRYDFKVNITH